MGGSSLTKICSVKEYIGVDYLLRKWMVSVGIDLERSIFDRSLQLTYALSLRETCELIT